MLKLGLIILLNIGICLIISMIIYNHTYINTYKYE